MAVNNSLTKTQGQRLGMAAYLNQDAVKNQVNSILGGKRGISFIASVVSAVQSTPALQECTQPSILQAALMGESLNLSPSASLGQFWIIPFNNRKKGVKEAQFQLGANGYKQLAMRTGQYKDIDFIEIHEGEYKGRDKFTGKQVFEFIEDDDERDALPVVGYMAYFELLNGFRKSLFWTKDKMEKHADKYSQAFSLEAYNKIKNGEMPAGEMWKYSSYWYTDFSGMAEKTLIKSLLKKWGILSTELIAAMDADESVINEDGTKSYVETETEPDVIEMDVPEVVEPLEPQQEITEDSVSEPTDAAAALFGE